MFHRLAKVLVLIAAVQILGGHWAVLQTLAWTGMLIENVRTAPISEAVTKTFDGSKPCSLCLAVKSGRESEGKQDVAKLLVKIEAILAPAVLLPPPASAPLSQVSPALEAGARSFPPQTPPPRVA